jgi:hypothetical protein
MMFKTALALFTVLVLVSSPVQARPAFSGSYTITGVNPGVGAYSGTLTITARGDVYDVYWTIANTHYSGVGVVVNDTLSVAYGATDHSWLGVMAYRTLPNGRLEGKWAVQGRAGAPGSETATRK